MADSFDTMGLNPTLISALKKEDIAIPTDVQVKVIPKVLENKDLIVQSETGTGKTLAYLLPLFQKLNTSAKEMQAIILVPTHELAIQIQRQIERLSQNSEIKATSTPVIGNVNIERQVEKLREKPHIIVGSTGRILELIKKRKISAHTIKTIILDEADRLLDENNLDSVKAVIKSTLKDRQLMAFSATISKDTEARAKELMKEPETIKGEQNISVPASIEHLYFVAEQRDKIDVLRKLVRILNPQKAVVFVNKNDQIENVTSKLQYNKLNAESIHGTNSKSDRQKTMEEFRTGKLQLLVASDIAARGLHIEGITHIFNLDLPENPKDYLHRVGRTGRIGNTGVAISIVTPRELETTKMFQRVLKITMTQKDMHMGNIVDLKRAFRRAPSDRKKPIQATGNPGPGGFNKK